MLTFKEFLLREFTAGTAIQPAQAGASSSNVTNSQLGTLQQKLKTLMKQKDDAQRKFDQDNQRAQAAMNALSEAGPVQSNPSSTGPTQSNTPSNASQSATGQAPDSPQMLMWKQKQQASAAAKANSDKKLDTEIAKTQAAINALSKQQADAGGQGQGANAKPAPGANVAALANVMPRSGNPEKTTIPSGTKTTQSIAPSARVGFGTSFS